MRIWSKVILTSTILVSLVSAFQNCARLDFRSSYQVLKGFGGHGNGENYDGKPFVHQDPANPCPDASEYRSVIVLANESYLLVKKDCSVVSPPHSVASSDVSSDPDYPAVIVFQDKKFIFDATSIATAPDLACVSRNIGPIDSVKVYSIAGADGPMLAGVVMGPGRSTLVAFDMTTIDTSSTGALAGIDQENSLYLRLFDFDSSAPYPDATNTKYQVSSGPLGSSAYLHCLRPSGTL